MDGQTDKVSHKVDLKKREIKRKKDMLLSGKSLSMTCYVLCNITDKLNDKMLFQKENLHMKKESQVYLK